MIPVNTPMFGGNEKQYLAECIDTGWISSEGPFVKRFESEFAARMGRAHGIAVCNGSAALDIAVSALELGPGDEVIMPSFTIISCAAAVIRSGAIPVFADSEPDTWNLDVKNLEHLVTPRTRAVMPVHIYGLPVDMKPLLEMANENDLRIIEDAAEAHGLDYAGQPCGSFGDISTFSFYSNKHVTTGEGGMLLTDDPVIAERCRSLRNLCFKLQQRFVHDELGWNYRMSNLQAAVGVAQLEQLDLFVKKKRDMGSLYTELLSDVPGLQLPLLRTDSAENVYWVFGLVLTDEIPFDASHVIKRLGEERIGSRPFFWPMHQQPVIRDMGLGGDCCLPVSERLARRGFYVPSGLALTISEIREIADVIKDIMA